MTANSATANSEHADLQNCLMLISPTVQEVPVRTFLVKYAS